ncbi:unnamed protein product [Caenorhabditis brenneri]
MAQEQNNQLAGIPMLQNKPQQENHAPSHQEMPASNQMPFQPGHQQMVFPSYQPSHTAMMMPPGMMFNPINLPAPLRPEPLPLTSGQTIPQGPSNELALVQHCPGPILQQRNPNELVSVEQLHQMRLNQFQGYQGPFNPDPRMMSSNLYMALCQMHLNALTQTFEASNRVQMEAFKTVQEVVARLAPSALDASSAVPSTIQPLNGTTTVEPLVAPLPVATPEPSASSLSTVNVPSQNMSADEPAIPVARIQDENVVPTTNPPMESSSSRVAITGTRTQGNASSSVTRTPARSRQGPAKTGRVSKRKPISVNFKRQVIGHATDYSLETLAYTKYNCEFCNTTANDRKDLIKHFLEQHQDS